jgi:sec-independent protein translocase protein TatC
VSDKSMSFTEHLGELRRRIVISLIAVAIAALAAFALSDAIIGILLAPSGGLQLKAFGVMDGFLIKWRVALYAGLVVSFPVWGYQVLAFVLPGLQ